ncbi:MAG: redoxin domain-containing protein [Planctomycetes bacterium]|nr:redoxin domain-containing protein [Planctomycetota bacterium]
MLTRCLSILCLSAWFCGHVHAQTLTISGKVLDPEGKPVAGAKVFLVISAREPAPRPEPSISRAESSQDGSFAFTFKGAKENDWPTVFAVKDGCGAWGMSFDARNTTSIEIRLARPGDVAGRVTDKKGHPIADVKVRVFYVDVAKPKPGVVQGFHIPEDLQVLSAITDAAGQFRIRSLPEGGRVSLSAYRPEYAKRHYPDHDREERPLQVGREDLMLTLVPAARITGRVVFEGTRKPLAGVRAFCSDKAEFIPSAETTTDKEGRFVLGNLSPGKYTVYLQHEKEDPEWLSRPKPVGDLTEGQQVDCGDVVLIRGGLVTGKVTDAETGDPIEQVQLCGCPAGHGQFGYRGTAVTDAKGVYKMRLPPGQHQVHFGGRRGYVFSLDDDWWHEGTTVTVKDGETAAGIDFKMFKAAQLKGTVVDPSGKPVPGVDVHGQRTADDGRFTLDTLRPNQVVTFCVFSPDRALGATSTAQAERGKSQTVTIRLAPLVQVTGKVTDEAGHAVKDARVDATVKLAVSGSHVDHPVDSGMCGVDGRFSLRLLSGPGHDLKAGAKGYGNAQMANLIATTEKDVGTITLKKADAFIAGRVTDPDGDPVAGAKVLASGHTQPRPSTTQTDDQGRYQLTGLANGKVHVKVNHLDYSSESRQEVQTGTGSLDFVLTPQRGRKPKVVLKVGDAAPEIEVTGWLQGEGLKELRELRGKVVLLQFAAPYNPAVEPCNEKLKELHQKYAQDGLVIVSIYDASLPANETAEYVKSKGIPWVVGQVAETPQMGWSSPAFKAYGVRSVPSVFVIDRSGKLGLINPALAELEAGIQKLLVER